MLIDRGDRSRPDTRDRSRRSRDDRRLFERYQRTGDPVARAELTERFLPLARR